VATLKKGNTPVTPRPATRPGVPLSDDEKRRIRTLHADGLGARAIARQVGRSRTAVQDTLRARR